MKIRKCWTLSQCFVSQILMSQNKIIKDTKNIFWYLVIIFNDVHLTWTLCKISREGRSVLQTKRYRKRCTFSVFSMNCTSPFPIEYLNKIHRNDMVFSSLKKNTTNHNSGVFIWYVCIKKDYNNYFEMNFGKIIHSTKYIQHTVCNKATFIIRKHRFRSACSNLSNILRYFTMKILKKFEKSCLRLHSNNA